LVQLARTSPLDGGAVDRVAVETMSEEDVTGRSLKSWRLAR
jgi:hypothetical protein